MFRRASSGAEAAASEASTPCLRVGVRCRWMRVGYFDISSDRLASKRAGDINVACNCFTWMLKRKSVPCASAAFGVSLRSQISKHCVMSVGA